MGTPLANGSVNTLVRKAVANTLTGLKRWSCVKRDLPGVSEVKVIYVYDFDNTLFKSPLPNSKLWAPSTIGHLQNEDCFVNGGWWHDQHILEATGEGVEKEEPKAWEGWWNEYIVELVTLSLEQKDALTVLLTGRRESNFAGLIKRMVASKNLSFDMICLKPQAGPNNQLFTSTMMYKQALLQDIMYTYKDADEITVYEDRVKHVEGFRKFFENFNKTLILPTSPALRKPIIAKVMQVAELATTLDPVVEAAEVQRMINSHNATAPAGSRRYEIKRNVFFTGYLFSPADSAKLLNFVKLPPGSESDFRFLADKILISHRLASASVLNKVGGIGHKQTWQVTGTACYESQIWAARVAPVPPTASYHTDTATPLVILALRKDARAVDAGRIQNWQTLPTEKQYIFQTVVGEKVQLRVDRANDGEIDNESPPAQRALKRRHAGVEESQAERDSCRPAASQSYRGSYGNDDNRRPGPGGGNGSYRGGNQNRGRGGGNGPGGGNMHRHPSHTGGRGGRGGGGGGGGGAGRGGGGNRGGRGRGGYKSLDDVGTGAGRYGAQGNAYQNAQQQQPNYDDGPSNDGRGGGDAAYNANFPPLGGGLPYGK